MLPSWGSHSTGVLTPSPSREDAEEQSPISVLHCCLQTMFTNYFSALNPVSSSELWGQ